MIRGITYGMAAAVLAALAGVLWFGTETAEAGFRKAMDKAEKAKSVRVVTKLDRAGQMTTVGTLHVQGDCLRSEDHAPNTVGIWDLKAKRRLVLDLTAKTARLYDLTQEALRRNVQEKSVPFDALKVLRETKDMTVRELDGEKIGDRPMRLYMFTHPGNQEHAATTGYLWVDARTGLPARVRSLGVQPETDEVMEFEAWNEPFDPKLFSLEVPKGYRLTDSEAPAKKADK